MERQFFGHYLTVQITERYRCVMAHLELGLEKELVENQTSLFLFIHSFLLTRTH